MRQKRTIAGMLAMGMAALAFAAGSVMGQAPFGGGGGGRGGGAAVGATSSATRARSEAERAVAAVENGGRGRGTPPPAPHEITVDEIVNFHHHNIPQPKAGQSVGLDIRLGNETASAGQPAVLQVGLSTADFKGTTDLPPTNLALVIDRSGSMLASDKMDLVKAALNTLIGTLRPHDIVSIVAFDSSAETLMPATAVGRGEAHRRVIDGIRPNGSTNLSDGLMLGYTEVLKNFRPDHTNRVIVLTDGIANVGITDPQRIAESSASFTERGIDLSTIGVGQDLDDNLLRTIAKRGHGLYYFLADTRDVTKTFSYEAQTLLSQVARNVRVEIASDPSMRLGRVYGYAPRRQADPVGGDRIAIDMDNFNNGMTEAIIAEYTPNGWGQITVRLSYFDISKQKMVEEVQSIALKPANGRNVDYLEDREVRKNYSIAGLAQGMSDMQQSWRRNDFRAAETQIGAAVGDTRDRYPIIEDADIRAQLAVAESFLATLRTFNNYNNPRISNCAVPVGTCCARGC